MTLQLWLVGVGLLGLGLMLWGFSPSPTDHHAHLTPTVTPTTPAKGWTAASAIPYVHAHLIDHEAQLVGPALLGTRHEHDHPYGWPTTGPNRKATDADDA